MWINPDTEQLFSRHDEIRRAFPQVSFPETIRDHNLTDVGLAPVREEAPPVCNVLLEEVVEGKPICVDGEWFQQWEVRKLSAEEAEARLLAHRQSMQATKAQLKIALWQMGMLDDVENLLLKASTDPVVAIAWMEAHKFSRLSPTIQALAADLGWADAFLDSLFMSATAVPV